MSTEVKPATPSTETDTSADNQGTVTTYQPKNHSESATSLYDRLMKQEALGNVDLADPKVGEELLEADADKAEETKGVDPNNITTPEQFQAIRKNMQASYTRKMQALAEKERLLEAQIRALQTDPHKEIAERQTAFDPFDPNTYDSHIETLVAKRLQAEREQMRQAIQLEQSKISFQNFVTEHPDIKDLAPDIKKVCDENPHLTPKDAYWMLKGQRAQDNPTQRARREAGAKIGVGQSGRTAKPDRKMTAAEYYEWLQSQK